MLESSTEQPALEHPKQYVTATRSATNIRYINEVTFKSKKDMGGGS